MRRVTSRAGDHRAAWPCAARRDRRPSWASAACRPRATPPSPRPVGHTGANDMNNDSFELLEVIGSGGFGTVHRAHQPAFSRDVAVKVLTTRLTDASARSRFDRASAARSGCSPVTRTSSTSSARASARTTGPYLVMEHLPGGTLDDRLRGEGRMPWRDAAEIGAKLASALQTAHERGRAAPRHQAVQRAAAVGVGASPSSRTSASPGSRASSSRSPRPSRRASSTPPPRSCAATRRPRRPTSTRSRPPCTP